MRATSVREEIKQSRPFRSASQEAVVALLRSAALLRNRFDAAVQHEGLTGQQYNVLRILRGAGTPLPTMEIADRLLEPAPGPTRLLDRIEAKGLVERSRCPEDRRRVLCELTEEGRAVVDRLDATMDEFDDGCFASLADEEVRALIGALDSVRAGLRSP
ncbi:MAG: MarR family transcriptional regulator [Gemmatimonadota bacterium]